MKNLAAALCANLKDICCVATYNQNLEECHSRVSLDRIENSRNNMWFQLKNGITAQSNEALLPTKPNAS
jgi:hypothetical protein